MNIFIIKNISGSAGFETDIYYIRKIFIHFKSFNLYISGPNVFII